MVDHCGIFLDCRYMTGKLLLKLDTVIFIVANHTIISALNYILKKKKTFSTFYLTVYEMNLYTYRNHSFLTFLISGGAVPFLEEYRCSPSRTTFHYTIGWLIFMEHNPVKFKSSMDPLLQVLISLSL